LAIPHFPLVLQHGDGDYIIYSQLFSSRFHTGCVNMNFHNTTRLSNHSHFFCHCGLFLNCPSSPDAAKHTSVVYLFHVYT